MSSSVPDAKGVRDGAGAAGRPSDSAKPDSRSRWTLIAGHKNNNQDPPPPPKGGGAAAGAEPPHGMNKVLVLAAQSGDAAALDALFELASKYAHKVARLILSDGRAGLASEVAQTALTNAFRRLETFDPARSEFPTWLGTIVRNEASKQRRREMRHPYLEEMSAETVGQLIAREPTPFASAAAREETEQRQRLLREHEAALPPSLRTAFAARRAGRTYAEFAEIEGIEHHAARSRFLRCLTRYRRSA